MSEQQGNTIIDLRGELFATIRALRDPANPMDIARAKAVADVAGRIIESAKAETEAARAFGRGVVPASGFMALRPRADTLEGQEKGDEKPRLPALESEAGTKTSQPARSPMVP